MAQEHIDFTTPGGDTVTQALHKAEDNFNDLYVQVAAAAATAGAAQSLAGVASFKNKLINGNFDFWQRVNPGAITSSGGAATAAFCADRWIMGALNCTNQVGPVTFNPGDSPVGPTGARSCASFTVSSITNAGTNSATAFQRIEGVSQSGGKTYTISGWFYNGNAAAINIGFQGTQTFGTGGSPSAQVTGISPVVISIPVGWSYKSAQVAFPSVAGKTLGTNSNDWFAITVFFSGAGVGVPAVGSQTGNFALTGMQIEEGSAATSYERRHLATELMLCQRYYEKSYQLSIVPGAVNDTNGTAACVIGGLSSASYSTQLQGNFKVTKRTVPTVTLYSPATGAGGVIRNFSASADFSPSSVQVGTNMVQINTGTMAAAASINVQAHWAADAEL